MIMAESRRRPAGHRSEYDLRPLCPDHGCTMRVGSTQRPKRYWYCPVAGCTCSRVEVRLRRRRGSA